MITLLDGGVGTSLWKLAEEAGVEKTTVWEYNMEHPELVKKLHKNLIAAGSQIILANTFGANRLMVERQSEYTVEQVVTAGVKLAKEAGANFKIKKKVVVNLDLVEEYILSKCKGEEVNVSEKSIRTHK